MGRKITGAAHLSEREALETTNNHEIDPITKRKRNTNKEPKPQEQPESNLKRKLGVELEDDNGGSEKSKKKHKKEKKIGALKGKLEELEEVEVKESNDGHEKKKKKKHNKAKVLAEQSKSSEDNKQLNGVGHLGEKKKTNGISDVEEENGEVVVTGKNSKEAKYKPLKTFAEAKLPKEVIDCCKNFKNPSPIQAHAWPFLLDGRDFIGIAKTGSGKTLAFGIPAIMHVLSKQKEKSVNRVNPLCLVLSPTRELAQQISDVICDAGELCGVKSVCLYGGTSKQPQISSLKTGVDIVIGTPGRLKDLIEMNVCCLSEVSFVVLDEADRMLDLGFEPEVRSILSKTSSVRQMVMFSATWPTDVHKLALEFMNPHPIKVVIGSEDLAANHDVMQIVEVLDERARNERLVALLSKYHQSQRNRVLVFALYKEEAKRLEHMLQKSGWKAVSIHGDKAQHERTKALSLFKNGSCPLMVATDVAARGLDIPDVEVVINYSFPLTTEDYVHRIGRTGRAGKEGVAHTFFTQHNKGLAGELVNVLREAGQIVPDALLKFGTHVKKKESKLYGAHFREISADAPKSTKLTFNSDDED